MPELPEVETIKRILEPQLRSRRVISVTVENTQVIAHPDVASFCASLTGQRITAMARRGKFLSLLLQSGDRVTLHLRMTGCLLVTPPGYPVEKHTHLVFHLDTGAQLRFLDVRRFGRFWLIQRGEPDLYSGIDRLGLEPFDASMNALYLANSLSTKRRPIKECLMDQSVVAGIGNIYSDEILFSSSIRPTRQACRLNVREWNTLAQTLPERLSYFIEKNALSPAEYLASKGQEYRNSPFLQVYGRDGQPCPRCGTLLERMTVNGRTSVYCPYCQK